MQISNVLPTDDVLDSMSRLAAAAVTTDRPTVYGDWTDRDELELELGLGWTDKPFCI